MSGNREKVAGEVKLCLCKEWEMSNSVLFGSLMATLFKRKKKIAMTQENNCVGVYLFPRMVVSVSDDCSCDCSLNLNPGLT